MALYLGRLNLDTSEDDIRDLLKKYGELERCEIKKGKGFGFATFKDERDAQEAVNDLKNATLLGNRILVEFAKGKEKKKDSNECFICGSTSHWARNCPDRDRYYDRRSRHRSRSRSRSRRSRSRSRSRRSRSRSHSRSRRSRRDHRSRSRDRSRSRSRDRSRDRKRSRSRSRGRDKEKKNGDGKESKKSPDRSPSPKARSASRSPSPKKRRSHS